MSLIPASLTFANPLGLWALLGLPVVVAIHFLQRRQRRVTCTTLFLLEQMRRESRTGNRFEKLRVSIPFWLQLLMVLLLAWLLAQPRWLGRDAVQRVAVVLDASASMAALASLPNGKVSFHPD
ncbi:MAG TPA: BatA domain-containing protein, partial [Prosthecobacter sp.]|nr:BatA domain-containing protein [Prosthecobacter sp.]